MFSSRNLRKIIVFEILFIDVFIKYIVYVFDIVFYGRFLLIFRDKIFIYM